MLCQKNVHECGVCYMMFYSTVSFELCAPNQFYYDMYCIGMSVKPVIGFSFALPSGGVSEVLFFDNAWMFNTMLSRDNFTVIHLLYMITNNDMSQITHESYISKIFVLCRWAIVSALYQSGLDKQPIPSNGRNKRKNDSSDFLAAVK